MEIWFSVLSIRRVRVCGQAIRRQRFCAEPKCSDNIQSHPHAITIAGTKGSRAQEQDDSPPLGKVNAMEEVKLTTLVKRQARHSIRHRRHGLMLRMHFAEQIIIHYTHF
jgi:hypothetical protein